MCWPHVPGTWCAMTVNSPRALALGITTQKTQVFQHLTLVVSSTVHHNLHPGLRVGGLQREKAQPDLSRKPQRAEVSLGLPLLNCSNRQSIFMM